MKNMLWYQSLNKPIFTPPDWFFAPVWTMLYILMGISLFLFIKSRTKHEKTLPLVLFFIQLGLNLGWTTVFFKYQQIHTAMVISIVLLILVLLTIQQFYKVSKVAAYLLVPYAIWLWIAAYLSIEIVRLNP